MNRKLSLRSHEDQNGRYAGDACFVVQAGVLRPDGDKWFEQTGRGIPEGVKQHMLTAAKKRLGWLPATAN